MNAIVTKIIKTESVILTIPIGAAQTDLYFPDDQYIRNKKLMGINFWTNINENATGGTPPQTNWQNGDQVADSTLAAFCYLTLESYSGVKFVDHVPLLKFNPMFNGKIGINAFSEFIGQRCNWPKCKVTIAPGATATTVKKSLLFDIHFTELSKDLLQTQLGVGFNNKT